MRSIKVPPGPNLIYHNLCNWTWRREQTQSSSKNCRITGVNNYMNSAKANKVLFLTHRKIHVLLDEIWIWHKFEITFCTNGVDAVELDMGPTFGELDGNCQSLCYQFWYFVSLNCFYGVEFVYQLAKRHLSEIRTFLLLYFEIRCSSLKIFKKGNCRDCLSISIFYMTQ